MTALQFKDAPRPPKKAAPLGALPKTLNRSLKATASLALTELFNEGKSAANDPSEWPLAKISERMDGDTCPLCASVDGKILKVGTPEYRQWKQPSHINCRRILVYIHKDEAADHPDFEAPDPELIRKHGHYHLNPEKHAALRIPAEPAGRQVIVRRVKDLATGEVRTVLDWAPWWDKVPKWKRKLVLDARVADDDELPDILSKLGLTDTKNAAHLEEAARLGLRDRVEGFVTLGYRMERMAGFPDLPGIPGAPLPSPPALAGKPAGLPVSRGVRVNSPAIAEPVEHAFRVLDSVHGDGELPPLAIRPKYTWKETQATFAGGRDVAVIRLGVRAVVPEVATLHEAGHYLQQVAQVEEALFRAVLDAANRTQAVQELVELTGRGSVTLRTESGVKVRRGVRGRYVRYLLQPDEIWARAYSQYLAHRSGDGRLRAQVAWLRQRVPDRVYYSRQWDDDDFEPVAKAIDELFLKLGWIE